MKRKIYCLLLAAGLLFWANPAYAGIRTPQAWQDADANGGRSWVTGGQEQAAYLVCQSAAERALSNDAGSGAPRA